jgi:hypothetical protein
MPATLRGGLSDLINTLNKLRNNTNDPEVADEIQKKLQILFALFEEVIRQEINSETVAFAKATAALADAERAAKEALEDLGKTAKAIRKAVKAAKAVDKIVQLIAKAFV